MTSPAVQTGPRRVLTVLRWPVGGIRTYLIDYYRPLGEAGYRFTFLGPAEETFRRFQDDVRAWPDVEFVEAPIVGGKCRLWSAVRRQLGTRRFCAVHSQGLTAGAAVALVHRGTRVPHLITSHDVFRPDQFPGPLGLLKRCVLARLLRRATALIAVGHDALQNHLDYLPGLARGKCRLVTIVNGIDVERLSRNGRPSHAGLRERLGLADDVFLMGFLGRFMKQKGFLVMVDALDRLARRPLPRPFHVVAVGSDDYVLEYREEVMRRPSLAGRITFLDVMTNVAPVLHELDLLVIPSLWEACPLLPMEAMCLGTPVLGSDCIGLREVLRGSPSVQVAAGSPGALAEGIERAMTKPWTEEARRYVPDARQRFNVGGAARQLRELLDDTLVNSPLPLGEGQGVRAV
ncbi:MAG: glycosyltransferase family 4 protein [Pirellulales bacterium]|nr:glycosyltransferase family 4 protein [Pirellulales bacterium]